MRVALIDHFDYYSFPPGRYLMAIRKMRDNTEDMKGAEVLHQVLVEAVAEAEAQFDIDMRWRNRKTHHVEHGDKAQALDRKLDQQLRGVDEVLASQQRFADTKPERAAAADDMRQALFPSGVDALTRMRFTDQCSAVFRLLKLYDATPSYQALARDLGLADAVETIRELNLAYAEEIGASVMPPRREKVQAGRRQIALRLGEIVARVFGMFPTEQPEDQEARVAMLEPIERQNEALRILNKRHAKSKSADENPLDDEAVLDIDPEDPEIEAA